MPPLLIIRILAWKPTEVKKITMHTFLSVSSNTNSTIPVVYKIQEITAKRSPPTTGDGIQNLSRTAMRRLRSLPANSIMTAIAIV